MDYSYNPKTDNKNDRTLQRFSTLAYYKMKPCHNCEYFKDFDDFMDYFGTTGYADEWIIAALAGESASFRHGIGNFDVDFTDMSYKARAGKLLMGFCGLLCMVVVWHWNESNTTRLCTTLLTPRYGSFFYKPFRV